MTPVTRRPGQRELARAVGIPSVVDTRETLVEAYVPKGARLAEVGVFEGAFSRVLLERCAPTALHLIDVFEGVHVCGDVHFQNMRHRDMHEVLMTLWREFARHDVVRLHKGRGVEVLNALPEASLDFVYVDALHDYASVAADLRAAARVSPHLIGGHDYAEHHFPGVVKAVKEFCWERNWTMVAKSSEALPSYVLMPTPETYGGEA